ncbi:MAG: modification methylase AplI [Bacteroidota bacterium]|jgi:DNA (cytosine-5)-methyltransferase 1
MKEIDYKISPETQEQILLQCISEKSDLQLKLKAENLSAEDFRYKTYPQLKLAANNYELVENKRNEVHNTPAISFFAGAGGFDIGFKYAGFNTLATFEINAVFCDTLKLNFPDKHIFNADLRNKEEVFDILKNKVGINIPFEGVFHGGPPCQPFSIAANQRFTKEGENFKRIGFDHAEYGNLLADYIWYISQFKPKVFIIENVAGLFEIDKGKQLFKELETLTNIGYNIAPPQRLNLSDYGIPQSRVRLFVVGSRDDNAFVFPEKVKQKVPCFYAFEKSLEGVANHETRVHKPESLVRYMQVNYGQRDHLGRVDRLDPQKPAKTVIAGGVKGGGRSHLHPFIPRTISVREAARLQTFPDSYVFTGPIARQFTQVGNAVPPLFAYKIGRQIYNQFYLRTIQQPSISLLFEEILLEEPA